MLQCHHVIHSINPWQYVLHMRTAEFLRQDLLSKHGVVVTDVPYRVRKEEKE
jgi:FixJ family two-component response regulator